MNATNRSCIIIVTVQLLKSTILKHAISLSFSNRIFRCDNAVSFQPVIELGKLMLVKSLLELTARTIP